jgi:hypothetical protein
MKISLILGSAAAVVLSSLTSTTVVHAFTSPGLPTVETLDLGQDKLINIFSPLTPSNSKADFALAQLIAHCPSFVEDRNVLTLQCSGLVSAAACKHGRPNHVCVSHDHLDTLAQVYTGCTQLHRSRASVSRCHMDWSNPDTWPNQKYDVLLASDVLQEPSQVSNLVNILQAYLTDAPQFQDEKAKRALIVDPISSSSKNCRDAFSTAAFRAGLEVDPAPFPGMEDDFILLSVTCS